MKTKSQYDGFAESPQTNLTPSEAAGDGSVWGLREAKAQLSEVVRRAQTEGPQRVTVRGREEVVVVSAAEFAKLRNKRTGQSLVDALAACPYPDFEFERIRTPVVMRDVDL